MYTTLHETCKLSIEGKKFDKKMFKSIMAKHHIIVWGEE